MYCSKLFFIFKLWLRNVLFSKRFRNNIKKWSTHTPSTAFRHLPPNSARFGYATEGALFISAQLSTDTVSALRKVLVLISL